MILPQVRRLMILTTVVSLADLGGSTAGVWQSRVRCGPALTANQEPLQLSPYSVVVTKLTLEILKGCCRCMGLTQSIVTVSSPLGQWMVMVLLPLLMTGKGPSYRGQRGGLGFSYKHMRAILESWGHVEVMLPRGSRWSAVYPGHSVAELPAKGPWFNGAGLDKEICGKGERGSVDHFCDGAL